MRSPRDRCRIVGAVRKKIAAMADRLLTLARSEQRTADVETVASELIPLCDALAWIARRGNRVLADRKVGVCARPVWMWGVRSVVHRVPWGRVLILGTWNYPILLSGVQTAQALAAGNTVVLKPAPGCEQLTSALVDAFYQSGVPKNALQLLDSSTLAATQSIADGVDLVVLTGAAATGRKVLRQTAEQLTPAIMELSGVDAVLVLPGADHERVVAAIHFGLLFNSGATCIGPRRVLHFRGEQRPAWTSELVETLRTASPAIVHEAARHAVADAITSAIEDGAVDLVGRFDEPRLRESGIMPPVVLSAVPANHAVLETDLFAPVLSLVPVENESEAIERINSNRYGLAAAVFGPEHAAQRVASRLAVGSVTVNDLIAPTADPRLPFGGRRESGFGVTRGPEGLLAMSTVQVISTRRGRIAPHLSQRKDNDAELLTGVLQLQHSERFRDRIAGFRRLATAAKRRD